MSEDIHLIRVREFVRTDASGEFDMAASRRWLQEMFVSSQNTGLRPILLDCREANSHLSVTEIFELALGLEEVGFGHRQRVAIVNEPRDGFDRAAFFETCARNRGFEVRAFHAFEAAVMWLGADG